MRGIVTAVLALCFVYTSAEAKPRKVIDPLPAEIVDNAQITAVEVIAEGKSAEALATFDQKQPRRQPMKLKRIGPVNQNILRCRSGKCSG